MADILERLRFDAARCEATFSKGVATNIEAAVIEIERLRAALIRIAAIENKMYGPDWEEIDEAREIANDALSRIVTLEPQ